MDNFLIEGSLFFLIGEKMKKITLALMLLLTVAQVSACNKEEKKADDASAKAPEAAASKAASSYDCSAVTVDSLKSKAKTTDKNKKKVLENDSYATILESLQCCTVDEKTFAIDKKSCVAHQTLDALKKDNILLPSLDTVAAQLAKHESPIVRGSRLRILQRPFWSQCKRHFNSQNGHSDRKRSLCPSTARRRSFQ